MTDTGIASIVRSLAEGVDPGRVLRDVAHEALSRTATSHLLLAAMLEGQLTPLVAIGSPHPVLFEVSRDAFSTGRAAHRSDPALGLAAMAAPVRTAGAEFAVCLPLVEDGPGALVLLVAEEPDAAGRRALDALRAQVAAGLRAARSAAAVEAAGTQLATLLNTLADPVLVVDPAGRFAALNPAAAELFALSDSFELGRPARGRLGHPGLEALLLGTEPSPGAGAPAEVVLG